MRRRARRRPVTVALGVRPVTWSAQNSLSDGDGESDRIGHPPARDGHARQVAEMLQEAHEREVLAAQEVSAPGRAALHDQIEAHGDVAHIDQVQRAVHGGRQLALGRNRGSAASAARARDRPARPASSDWPPPPAGPVGPATNAYCSARSFDRQYGPTVSSGVISTFSSIGRPAAGLGQDALGAGVEHPLRAGRQRGVEDVDRPLIVHAIELAAIAAPQVGIRRQVIDPTSALHGRTQADERSRMSAKTTSTSAGRWPTAAPGRSTTRTRLAGIDQLLDQMAADETRAARHDRQVRP